MPFWVLPEIRFPMPGPPINSGALNTPVTASMPFPFGSATVPVTSVPMRLFWIVPPPAFMKMAVAFPEMRLPSEADGPPIVRFALAIWTPPPFGTATVPVASVPM